MAGGGEGERSGEMGGREAWRGILQGLQLGDVSWVGYLSCSPLGTFFPFFESQ